MKLDKRAKLSSSDVLKMRSHSRQLNSWSVSLYKESLAYCCLFKKGQLHYIISFFNKRPPIYFNFGHFRMYVTPYGISWVIYIIFRTRFCRHIVSIHL